MLTVEDNYGAGLGSAVADVLGERGTPFVLRQMYTRRIPKSGREPGDVLQYRSLSASDIMKEAVSVSERAVVAS